MATDDVLTFITPPVIIVLLVDLVDHQALGWLQTVAGSDLAALPPDGSTRCPAATSTIIVDDSIEL